VQQVGRGRLVSGVASVLAQPGDLATQGGGDAVSERHDGANGTVTLVIAVAALVVGALAVAGLGSGSNGASAASSSGASGSCPSGAPKMTVHGTGMATGTPDLLTLSLSVNVNGGNAQAALADNNTKTQAVMAALVAGGVPQHDIQTTDLTVNPTYSYAGGTQTLTGYGVTDSVMAKLRDFVKAGSVIDSASGAGGNAVQISSLTFSIEDPRPLQDRARHDAVSQAVSHASSMAAAAGERLGQVCSLTDDTTETAPYPEQEKFAAGTAAGLPAVPIEAGTQQDTAQVTLVYSLEKVSRR
jgi:uncharacterized protein YggE